MHSLISTPRILVFIMTSVFSEVDAAGADRFIIVPKIFFQTPNIFNIHFIVFALPTNFIDFSKKKNKLNFFFAYFEIDKPFTLNLFDTC